MGTPRKVDLALAPQGTSLQLDSLVAGGVTGAAPPNAEQVYSIGEGEREAKGERQSGKAGLHPGRGGGCGHAAAGQGREGKGEGNGGGGGPKGADRLRLPGKPDAGGGFPRTADATASTEAVACTWGSSGNNNNNQGHYEQQYIQT